MTRFGSRLREWTFDRGGFIIWGSLLATIGSCCYYDTHRESVLNRGVKLAYDSAAGDDRRLSRDEELKLYRDLGFSSTIKDKSVYRMVSSSDGREVELLEDGVSVEEISGNEFFDKLKVGERK